MLACLSDVPVDRATDREATLRGLAFLVAGEPADFGERPMQRFEPERDERLLARYLKWLELMRRPPAPDQSRSSSSTISRSIQLGPRKRIHVPAVPAARRDGHLERRRAARARSRSRARIIGSSCAVMMRAGACRPAERIARDRVAAEVAREVREFGVLQHHALGHARQRPVADQFAEVVDAPARPAAWRAATAATCSMKYWR